MGPSTVPWGTPDDLPDYIKHSQIRLFADDNIILYRPIKTQADCIQLQEHLESAVKWEHDWLMAFHRFIYFGRHLLNVIVPI
jgi:hypothetical protein